MFGPSARICQACGHTAFPIHSTPRYCNATFVVRYADVVTSEPAGGSVAGCVFAYALSFVNDLQPRRTSLASYILDWSHLIRMSQTVFPDRHRQLSARILDAVSCVLILDFVVGARCVGPSSCALRLPIACVVRSLDSFEGFEFVWKNIHG